MKGNFHVPFWEEREGAISPSYSAGYNGYDDIMENGHMIFGLKVASKVFTIIYNAELGKSDALPRTWVETSQEVTMVQRIKDMEKSECRLVIDRI